MQLYLGYLNVTSFIYDIIVKNHVSIDYSLLRRK